MWLPIDSNFLDKHYALTDAYEEGEWGHHPAGTERIVGVPCAAWPKTSTTNTLLRPTPRTSGYYSFPIEGLYAEIVRHRPNWRREPQRQYRILIAGPTNSLPSSMLWQMGFVRWPSKRSSEGVVAAGPGQTEFGKFGATLGESQHEKLKKTALGFHG
ncbi:MAG: hypothetical protein R2806_20405 [Saprospiraceae bacterium]